MGLLGLDVPRPFESHRAPQVGEDKARRVLQPCGARMGCARFSRHTEVPSKNPLADRGAQGTPAHAQSAWAGVRRWGKMVLVTFAETKVTRARGGTRIKNTIAAGDTNPKYPARGAGTA